MLIIFILVYIFQIEIINYTKNNLTPFTYIIIMIVAIIFSPIPSAPLAIIAANTFKPHLALIYTLIGAEIGAIIAFILSRYFITEYIKIKFKKQYNKINFYSENKLAIIIFTTRLLPIFQFDIISYLGGTTKISLQKFSIATFFGMIPVTIILIYSSYFLSIKNILIYLIIIGTIILLFKKIIPTE